MLAIAAPALAQATLQRAADDHAGRAAGGRALAVKPAVGCTPVCIKQGCMPELKNNSAAPIDSGTPMAFSTKPEGLGQGITLQLPASRPPGRRTGCCRLDAMSSCRAWVK